MAMSGAVITLLVLAALLVALILFAREKIEEGSCPFCHGKSVSEAGALAVCMDCGTEFIKPRKKHGA